MVPVGGPRMRPCIEDFLQMLIVEFGFDAVDGWRRVIDDGRVLWRRRQLAAMIRDDAEYTAEVLRDRLGYEVTPQWPCIRSLRPSPLGEHESRLCR
jgi:hypothetical protein